VVKPDKPKSPINSEADKLSIHGETGSIQMFNCVIDNLNVNQLETDLHGITGN